MYRFSYLGSRISSDGRLSDEVPSHTWKTRSTFAYYPVIDQMLGLDCRSNFHTVQNHGSCMQMCEDFRWPNIVVFAEKTEYDRNVFSVALGLSARYCSRALPLELALN